ncbi:serine/threonine-protein kinase [Micromonospora inyonensis]|uniref:non-specific serine/threonine protein kinase n=1 Tax=Micromonospora inyonensis TaxID=47866 RepID=A0A1C6RAR7_9ACTN|nr:serine/threonine-protein kinase [Micromonospora inyonensis]SCL14199.1 serine/threonine protein kinase [Micromonospora inyonensis]
MGGGVRKGAQLLGDRYRLIEQIGAGGMSVVWRGYDEVLGRQVAVKVLASRLASDRSFRHRIRTEAQSAARLVHPHITNVYDYGESEQVGLTVPYVVMELVDGPPLTARLGRDRSLPWREALAIAAETAAALATAHARGVVHRDVTPGNVMLTATGVKVVDFGISALVGESEKGPDGTLLGTPAYLAPERLENGQVSPATDVYAVGLLLYRMLTGRLPWEANTTTQMLRAHMHTDPEPMPPVPGLPDDVVELVRRCLAKRPEDRPSSVELARTLAEAAGVAAVVPVSPAGPSDPGLLAAANTTILPWSAATDALPLSVSRSRRVAGRRRRQAQAGAVAAGLLAVTGVVWGMSGQQAANGDQVTPDEARLGLDRPAPCTVSYALRRDDGRTFAADVTLTNTGSAELRDWTMRFTLPGDQTVAGPNPTVVRQQDRIVEVRPAAAGATLAPGAAEKVTLTGRYAGANPLPVRFQLGEDTCEVQVAGVAGTSPTPTPPPAVTPAGGGTTRSGGSTTTGTGTGTGTEKREKSDKSNKGGETGGDSGKSGGGKKEQSPEPEPSVTEPEPEPSATPSPDDTGGDGGDDGAGDGDQSGDGGGDESGDPAGG